MSGQTSRPAYLTKKHVAQILGVHPSTVVRWVKTNGLPSPIRLGPNRTVWKRSEFEHWQRRMEKARAYECR